MKRKVDVNLLGQHFSVRTERDAEYVQSLAAFVTRRFEELKKGAKAASTQQIALLLALNLADELQQAVERGDVAIARSDDATESVRAALTDVQEALELLDA
jgi:cell division protein ZapA